MPVGLSAIHADLVPAGKRCSGIVRVRGARHPGAIVFRQGGASSFAERSTNSANGSPLCHPCPPSRWLQVGHLTHLGCNRDIKQECYRFSIGIRIDSSVIDASGDSDFIRSSQLPVNRETSTLGLRPGKEMSGGWKKSKWPMKASAVLREFPCTDSDYRKTGTFGALIGLDRPEFCASDSLREKAKPWRCCVPA